MFVEVFFVWGGLKYVIYIYTYIYIKKCCVFFVSEIWALHLHVSLADNTLVHDCMNCFKSRNYVLSQMLHLGNIYLIPCM